MKIVVDQNIRAAEATFGRHGDLIFMDGRQIKNRHLRDARALIIRTATRVDERLLAETRIGFVGTTSIGTDHMDIHYLQREGISWASAPGCNADSAAQYTLAMIWLACKRLGRRLKDQRVGIIGRGNVGSRVQRLLRGMGADTVANDPPLAEIGEPGLTSLQETLNRDIVCLHVPLTRDGPFPTYHMIDAELLAQIPDGALLVNTARGDVVVADALLQDLQAGRLHAALDVWPGEPVFASELLDATTVATPHVAGYSDDGKWKGTRMVYEAFCRWSGLERVPLEPPHEYPPAVRITCGEDSIDPALDAACFVQRHDREMRALASLTPEQRAFEFDRLRREYPPRRDFQAWQVECNDPKTAQALEKLGFSVVRVQ